MVLEEFYTAMEYILQDEEFRKLHYCKHHPGLSRMEHSIHVAKATYHYCKSSNIDWVEAVEAALLHDFYLVDWRSGQWRWYEHFHIHPKVALENARRYLMPTQKQEDAILNHMWPFSGRKPKTIEGFLVNKADKLCTAIEIRQAFREKVAYSRG